MVILAGHTWVIPAPNRARYGALMVWVAIQVKDADTDTCRGEREACLVLDRQEARIN